MTKQEIIAIVEYGWEVWDGDKIKFFKWMNTPCKALGGEIPIKCEYRSVMNEMGRIWNNIYT